MKPRVSRLAKTRELDNYMIMPLKIAKTATFGTNSFSQNQGA